MGKRNLEIRDRTIFDGVIGKYILKLFFKVWFKLRGWKAIGNEQQGAGITIAAPHTSNWDVVYAMGAAILLDIKIYFSIKESWCRKPVIGRIMMWLGAIPISRETGAKGQIEKITQFVNRHKQERIFILFTPEGTRGKAERWKTGFYHLAVGCDLPIFLAKVDFKNKESGVFHSYQPTGNKENDILSIQASYKNIQGKYPEQQYPEYVGPIPELSDFEARVLKTLYMAKGAASHLELAAKLKAQKVSTSLLDFLVEKGVLAKTDSIGSDTKYVLTFAGKGCLLHLFPALPKAG